MQAARGTQVWPECLLGWHLWKTGGLRNGEAGSGLLNRLHRHHRDGDPDLCLLITAVLCLFVTSLLTVLPTRTLGPGCVSSLSNVSRAVVLMHSGEARMAISVKFLCVTRTNLSLESSLERTAPSMSSQTQPHVENFYTSWRNGDNHRDSFNLLIWGNRDYSGF